MQWCQREENAPYLMTIFFLEQSLCEKVVPMNNFVREKVPFNVEVLLTNANFKILFIKISRNL